MIVDLNCDVGESPEAIANGSELRLLRHVTSINIACGEHAGDDWTMEQCIRAALDDGASVGAHPAYPDRTNFGRLRMPLTPAEIEETVFSQISRLARHAISFGAALQHVKPHGALYNVAARDAAVAEAIANGVARWNPKTILVGMANSVMLETWKQMGFAVAAEAFADRAYEANGTLRSRAVAGALITDPAKAAKQALDIVMRGRIIAADGTLMRVRAQTICIHGDTPGAVAIAAAVATKLRDAGVELRPLRYAIE